MTKLLVVGAINTDLIAYVHRAPEAGETVAGGHFEQHGGGKGANQAVAAARSGVAVSLLSAVGADAFGKTRLDELAADGIDTSSVSTLDSVPSGVAIIIVESNGENRICDLPGAREHITPDACLQVLDASSPTAILAANELSRECLRAIFLAAGERSIPVWFNVAPYSDGARELLPYVNTLIVNRGEAEDLLGMRGADQNIDQVAGELLGLGVSRVIVTLGADGVRGYGGEDVFRIEAEPVTPVDTTGAGDTFCGAWAAAMIDGDSFAHALAYANKAAAISVTRRGAQSSIPTRDKILRK